MANIQTAIQYVLRWEDATLSGIVTRTPDGKRTRFGIDEHFHPELSNCLFYDSMGATAALKIAEGIYDRCYCQPLCLGDFLNQDIANKVLSLGVNCGVGTAAKMLQQVLEVEGDGRIGPITLDKLDRADAAMVLDRLRALAESHYERIIQHYPELAINRAGWLRRAEA
jgi:lysozyme family protein